MKQRQKCECADPGCPQCHGHCKANATGLAFRVDMEDRTGTPMCSECGDDAMNSGVFRWRNLPHTTATPATTEGSI